MLLFADWLACVIYWTKLLWSSKYAISVAYFAIGSLYIACSRLVTYYFVRFRSRVSLFLPHIWLLHDTKSQFEIIWSSCAPTSPEPKWSLLRIRLRWEKPKREIERGKGERNIRTRLGWTKESENKKLDRERDP